MSTLKPYKLTQANKQVSKLKGVKIPTEIKEAEKNYFHALIIDSRPNPKTMEFDHNVKNQIINPESFERNKRTYKQLGYSNFVIYHDPLLQKQTDSETKTEPKK